MCSEKCEYLNDEPILINMFSSYIEECDLWDQDGYCRHCDEITYQCSQCSTDLVCTHCEATMQDDSVLVFAPYLNPDETQSCLIPECVETDSENYRKCIKCEQEEDSELHFLA